MHDATLLERIIPNHLVGYEIAASIADRCLDGIVVVDKNARIILVNNHGMWRPFDVQLGANYFRCLFGLDPETQQSIVQKIPAHNIITGSRVPTEFIHSILIAKDGMAYQVITRYNESWQAVYEHWRYLGVPGPFKRYKPYIDLTP